MSLNRIRAILLQELYITQHSLEVIVDLGFFSLIYLVIFGFISLYLAGAANETGAKYLLIGMILWEIVRINQYSVTVGSLWNIWSKNLSNMFVAPVSIQEYLTAHMLSGVIKTFVIFLLMIVISIYVFNFNIFSLGYLNLILYFINLTLFSWSMGLVTLGFIFLYGTRIQALAWSISYVFQPLTAAFFPVKVLPTALQKIAYLFPPTYVFEAARANVINPSVDWNFTIIAFVQNILYFIFSLWIFNIMFKKSKESGQFSRNEN